MRESQISVQNFDDDDEFTVSNFSPNGAIFGLFVPISFEHSRPLLRLRVTGAISGLKELIVVASTCQTDDG